MARLTFRHLSTRAFPQHQPPAASRDPQDDAAKTTRCLSDRPVIRIKAGGPAAVLLVFFSVEAEEALMRRRFAFSTAAVLFLISIGPVVHGDDPPQPAAEEGSSAPPAWPSRWVTGLAPLSDDANAVVAATAEGLLYRPAGVLRVDPQQPETATTLYEHPVSVWAVAVAGGRVLSSDYRGNLAVYDLDGGAETIHEGVLEQWTRALTAAPDGNSVVAGNEVGKLFVWSLDKNAIAQTAELDAQQIYSIRFAPDGQQIAVADGAGHVHLLSWPQLEPQRKFELGQEAIWDVTFLADGSGLLAAGADRKIWRVPFADEATPTELATTTDWVSSLRLDASGNALFVGLLDGQVLMASLSDGSLQPVGQLESGIWDLLMPSADLALVATRKDAVAVLGRSWNVQYAGTPRQWNNGDE
jgi:WD40 repeat protein